MVGNIVEAIASYARGELSDLTAPGALRMQDADRIIAIGSDRMMAAVAAARHAQLAPYLKPQHLAYGSINSPMQCMMKEVCAQCLQPHKDPHTGKVTYVFSCFNQDQPLDAGRFSGPRPASGAERAAGAPDRGLDRHYLAMRNPAPAAARPSSTVR